MKKFILASAVLLFGFSACTAAAPQHYKVRVVAEYPHDRGSYTQGLFFDGGQLYESALVREAIYAKARHIMKLKFDMIGSAQRSLYNAVKVRPNPWSTWPDFLERCNNIYETENNLIIRCHMKDDPSSLT